MAKGAKKLVRIRNNPKDVSFSELVSVLEDNGFQIRQGKSSHYVASHPTTGATVTFVRRNPVRRAYVERCLDAIDEAISLTA